MNRNKHNGNKSVVIVMSILIVIGIIGGILYWKKPKPQHTAEPVAVQPTPSTTPPISEESKPQQTIVDYQKIETDKDLKSLMEQRKSEYGVDKSVDMILTSEETLSIGNVTVPMSEILDKIRIQKGQVSETDLTHPQYSHLPPIDKERFRLEYMKTENRSVELVKLLINPEIVKDQKSFLKYAKEYAEVLKKLKDFRAYQQIVSEMDSANQILKLDDPGLKKKIFDDRNIAHLEIDRLQHQLKEKLSLGEANPSQILEEVKKIDAKYLELEKFITNPDNIYHPEYSRKVGEHAELKDIHMLAQTYIELIQKFETLKEIADKEGSDIRKAIQEKLSRLSQTKEQLEQVIANYMFTDKKVEVYGIYVVQPGDNIWNIHFNFLKEYFQTRNITISPKADEPDERGQSSGVGKILKFSEKMVYIFNVKDTSLSYDLNMIHPLSKIVIFNMGQALSLLEQIDYAKIKHIRFDGERLWLPAEG